jgi:hypothetical protein
LRFRAASSRAQRQPQTPVLKLPVDICSDQSSALESSPVPRESRRNWVDLAVLESATLRC